MMELIKTVISVRIRLQKKSIPRTHKLTKQKGVIINSNYCQFKANTKCFLKILKQIVHRNMIFSCSECDNQTSG